MHHIRGPTPFQMLVLRLELPFRSIYLGSGESLRYPFNELLFPPVEYDWIHNVLSG